MRTILHVGPCDTVETACDTLTAWIGAHAMAVAGPPREVNLSEPDTPPDKTKTIVEFPVSQVAAPVATG